jgi:hypothetical protein
MAISAELFPDLLFRDVCRQGEWKIIQLLQSVSNNMSIKRFEKKIGTDVEGIGIYFVTFLSDEIDNSDNEAVLPLSEMSCLYENIESKGVVKIVKLWLGETDCIPSPFHVVVPLGIERIDSNFVINDMFANKEDGTRKNNIMDFFFNQFFRKNCSLQLSLNLLFVPNAKVEWLKYVFPRNTEIDWRQLAEKQIQRAKEII